MDFVRLYEEHKALMESLEQQVDALLSLAPILEEKARADGFPGRPDHSGVANSLAKLTAAQETAAGARRRRPATKPRRYRLVWKKDGSPVLDAEGQPVEFKTQIHMLRGPKYEQLLGKKVGDVQLVDTLESDRPVVTSMTLGPAPGGRR